MKPGMRGDRGVLRRRTGADADGNPISASLTVWSGDGRYGQPGSRDLERASRAGQAIAATYATEAPRGTFLPGDILEMRGTKWRVLSETDVRLHVRVSLEAMS